jgi:RHH-type proline utilization regulon transcriptional repressor/proline dehydrogenase/delta 1-pyrroline-5-carboxylate dehydrogenase
MSAALESRILQIGRDIFAGIEKESPSIFKKDFWAGRMMEWSMKDEDFKVRMFRFVDVFPVLSTPEQVARHLNEYFDGPDRQAPAWMQVGLRSLGDGTGLLARTATSQIERNLRTMAETFVAGSSAREVLPRLQAMRKAGIAFTVDLLGEAALSDAEAAQYVARYRDLIEVLSDAAPTWNGDPLLDESGSGPVPRVNISIKVSSLDSQISAVDAEGSVARLTERLLPLFVAARERGAFLNLDMESHALKDLTLALFRRLLGSPGLEGFSDAGIVIQAYLKDSLADLRALLAWAKAQRRRVTVRLVKGAYWDYETALAHAAGWPCPVYERKSETDANYEACTRLLLENHEHVRAAFGSHNVRSIAHAMAVAESLRLDRREVEVQMLYGMAEPLKQAVRQMGYRVRDYTPVGELVPGMAYLVRRLLENTSNEGFLRARFAEQADAETLLRDPATVARSSPPPPAPPEVEFSNEPLTDWADADARRRMRVALDRARARGGERYPLSIGGQPVSTSRTIVSRNPASPAEVIGTVDCAGIEEAELAVRQAYAAFAGWRDRGAAGRATCLRRLAQLMREHRDDLAATMVLEVGKNWSEADADVAEAIDFCEYYAAGAVALMGLPRRLGRLPGELNHLLYQPMGVGAVIAPWNFPLAILAGMTAGALATGNCVVVKPAEQSPVIAARFVRLCHEAGIPGGVVNFLPGFGEEVGAHLVAHRWTRFVAFTGSREVGLQIIRTAGDTRPEQPGVKRVICEMGGKNAIIVDDDADLDEAVAGVLSSAFGFQGQKCSACSRVIPVGAVADSFTERLVQAASSLHIGPAADSAFRFGPVIDAESVARIRGYVALGRAEARPLLVRDPLEEAARRGDGRLDPAGHYAPFALFDQVKPDSRLAQEEIFGPVLAVLRARNLDEAFELANATSYALTGGVFSRSPRTLDRARSEFRVGNLYLNRGCTGALVFRQPFGGFKYSGIGAKAGGPNYLHQFVEERAISENTMRRGFAPSGD